MTAHIKGRGWDLVSRVKEIGSGAKQRLGREELLKAARSREVDVVVVWRLDRWGRSLPDLVVTLREPTEWGIGFVSLSSARKRHPVIARFGETLLTPSRAADSACGVPLACGRAVRRIA